MSSQLRQLIGFWRVFACTTAAQIVGYLVAPRLLVSLPPYIARDVGAEIGAGIGFIPGALWYLWPTRRRTVATILLTTWAGMTALGLTGMGLLSAFERSNEMEKLRRMATLSADAIERVAVYDEYGETRVAVVDDRGGLEAFAEAMVAAEPLVTAPDRYANTWLVQVEQHEVTDDLLVYWPRFREDIVVIDLLGDIEPRQSGDLRNWFAEHVPVPQSD